MRGRLQSLAGLASRSAILVSASLTSGRDLRAFFLFYFFNPKIEHFPSWRPECRRYPFLLDREHLRSMLPFNPAGKGGHACPLALLWTQSRVQYVGYCVLCALCCGSVALCSTEYKPAGQEPVSGPKGRKSCHNGLCCR